MSDGFDKLREIGAQKIHEKTHITREHVQAILHDSFEGMNKIQFLGFVSILERDYDVKLNDLKIRGLDYFLNITPETYQNTSVFVETKKTVNSTPYIVIALLIIVIVVFFTLNKTFSTHNGQKAEVIDNDTIENIQSNVLENSDVNVDTNSSTVDENSSILEQSNFQENKISADEDVKSKAQEAVTSFKVLPNKKLWMGYIDLKEDKSYQKLFLDELSLDPSKDWLLYLGHGNVNFDINGKILQYNSTRNLKFLYKDHNLTEISNEQFEIIKKDHKW